MHARVVLGVGKGVLFREVSSVQECPHRERGSTECVYIIYVHYNQLLYIMQECVISCVSTIDSSRHLLGDANGRLLMLFIETDQVKPEIIYTHTLTLTHTHIHTTHTHSLGH